MNRSAGRIRINFIVLFGVLGLAAIGIILLLSERSPESAAETFMVALAKHDVKTLAEMSYLEGASAPLENLWRDCVENKAKNYVFMWNWEGFRREGADEAVGRITITEFKGPVSDDNETVELPLVKRDGKWKVDLASLSRKFFPCLPR